MCLKGEALLRPLIVADHAREPHQISRPLIQSTMGCDGFNLSILLSFLRTPKMTTSYLSISHCLSLMTREIFYNMGRSWFIIGQDKWSSCRRSQK